jgi:alanine-synthesizing transaminase
MNFSKRLPRDLISNRFFQVLDCLSGKDIIDLTVSNPTKCGFQYPSEILGLISHPHSLIYEPDPRGQLCARKAVSDYLAKKGRVSKPESIILTSSTSEAYSFIFKLLCDPGDSLFIPTPGYPLLEHLASLEGIKAVPYTLDASSGWSLDVNSIEKAISPKIKGLVVVNPHIPTGMVISQEQPTALFDICFTNHMAYVSDEVFRDYVNFNPGHSWDLNPEILSFRLNGLSKTMGLPQLKLSWMVLEGPEELVSKSLERMEFIADTYLSVGTPIQLALPELLKYAPAIQDQIMRRITQNRTILDQNLKDFLGVKIYPAQGGWISLVEVLEPKMGEEEMVITLLEKHMVMVHPGSFYDIPGGSFMVISLLPPEPLFLDGLSRIRRFLEEM